MNSEPYQIGGITEYGTDGSVGNLIYIHDSFGHAASVGNMLTKGSTSFTWTQGRKLASVSNGKSIQYAYDHTGNRVKKTVNGTVTEYHLAGNLILSETTGDSTQSYRYDSTGRSFSVSIGGKAYYYLHNLQGDVIGLIDTAGTLVAEYKYDSWGKVLSITKSLKDTIGVQNPFRYRGYYYDAETGMYYLQNRYYDPEVCKFISTDNAISEVGGDSRGYNLYSYCFNNPINMNDPNGNWPKWVTTIGNAIKKAVNTVVSKVKTVVLSVKNTIQNVAKQKSSSLPTKGQPGSSQTLNNPDGTPKQKRWYGPDGNAERDRDYNHFGDMEFPHDHVWDNGKRGKDHLKPSPDYSFSLEPLAGIALVGVCAVGMIIVAADDVTGIGVADNGLVASLSAGIGKGLVMIFS